MPSHLAQIKLIIIPYSTGPCTMRFLPTFLTSSALSSFASLSSSHQTICCSWTFLLHNLLRAFALTILSTWKALQINMICFLTSLRYLLNCHHKWGYFCILLTKITPPNHPVGLTPLKGIILHSTSQHLTGTRCVFPELPAPHIRTEVVRFRTWSSQCQTHSI